MSVALGVSQLSKESRIRDAHTFLAGAFDLEPMRLILVSYFEKGTGGSQPMQWEAGLVCRDPEDGNRTICGFFRWVRVDSLAPGRAAFEWVRVTNQTGFLK